MYTFEKRFHLTGDVNGRCTSWFSGDTTDPLWRGIALSISNILALASCRFSHALLLQACLNRVVTNIRSIEVTSSAPLGRSDHVVLVRHFDKSTSISTGSATRQRVWWWRKANVPQLNILNADWTDITSCQDIQVAWNRWREKLLHLAGKVNSGEMDNLKSSFPASPVDNK